MNENNQEISARNQNWVSQLTENIIVPAAVLSAVGYYLGWTATSAYYVALGLSPSFIKKSPQEFWSYSWVEVILAALLLIFCFGIYKVIENLFSRMRSGRRSLLVFFILWFVSVSGIIVFGLQTTVYRSDEPGLRLRSIAFFGLFVLGLLIAACVGKFIQQQKIESDNNRSLGLFGFVFPNYYIYFIVVVLGLVFALSRVAALRGLIAGLSDASPSSRLSKVTLYSATPLPLNGAFDPSQHLYVYQNYSLVDATDDYIFILQVGDSPTTITGITTFAIPKKSDIILQVTR